MLAKLADELPPEGGYLYEPKWDGFRAVVFRGEEDVYIQSRDSRPLDRYFPELHDALLERLPKNCVVDGEIVIATAKGLDFDALQLRLHPAESRVAKLAKETPSSFVAFDLLFWRKDLRAVPQAERRVALGEVLGKVKPPVYLTPVTRERNASQPNTKASNPGTATTMRAANQNISKPCQNHGSSFQLRNTMKSGNTGSPYTPRFPI